MRTLCGQCGCTTPDLHGCPRCGGPAFDAGTPAGLEQLRAYRAIQRHERRRAVVCRGLLFLLVVLAVAFLIVPLLAPPGAGASGSGGALTIPAVVAGFAAAPKYRRRTPEARALDAMLARG
jgi:hypothetical protein